MRCGRFRRSEESGKRQISGAALGRQRIAMQCKRSGSEEDQWRCRDIWRFVLGGLLEERSNPPFMSDFPGKLKEN